MSTIYTRATKGSALTWTEGDANITNLNNDKIEAVSDDTTPQLGGDLDVAGFKIVSSASGNIDLQADGTGIVRILNDGLIVGDGVIDAGISSNGAHDLSIVTNTGVNSGSITIIAGANNNIEITPNGTGKVDISGLLFPNTDGTNGQVLTTDGAGVLSFATVSGSGIDLTDLSVGTEGTASGDGSIAYDNTTGVFTYTPPTASGIGALADVVNDTTPQLGGSLDVNGQSIVSVSNGNINITPNGTGQTVMKNIEYNEFIHSLGTTSGTITPNVANGNVQTITLNGNLTFSAFTSPVAGQSLTLIINTNGTSRTLTSTMKFAGGSKTLSTTNTTDIISVFYDGTNYWASLSKDFV